MKKFLALILALLMVFSIIGCAKEDAPADDTADDASDIPAIDFLEWEKPLAEKYATSGDEEFTLAIIVQAYTDKFNMRILDRVKEYVGTYYPNCTLLEGDGELDANIQIGLVENYIAQDVDALMFIAVDSYACGSVCGLCKDAGLPLVAPCTDIDCGDATCDLHNFVGSDHYYSGQLQGEYIVANVDDTETVKLCYLEGTNGFDHAVLRKAGFFDTLDAAGFNYELLSSLEGQYTRDLALQISEDWFVKYGEEIDAIVAANDEMAWGALEAMKGAGLEGVVFCGIDCNDDTKNAIQNGEIQMSVYQNAEKQGMWSAIAAYNAAAGNPTGKISVPYESVTIENLENYM